MSNALTLEEPFIHSSHFMKLLDNDVLICGECDRCSCHRQLGLGFICPVLESILQTPKEHKLDDGRNREPDDRERSRSFREL